MQNEIKVINEQVVLGKEFKVYGTVEQPYFLAKEVAEWIEHSNPSKMLNSVDEDEKTILPITISYTQENTHGGLRNGQECSFLTEDGVYEVLMQSRKPIAKQFKKEVKKILKQMRLTGGVVVEDREEEFISNYFPSFSEDVKLAMVQDLRTQNNKLKAQIEEQKDLVTFAETVANSSDNIDMGEMAKLCNKEGIKIGRNRLFDFLREEGLLRANNEPYQKYIENGVFTVIETTKSTPYGEKLFCKTLVTGKGQIKIVELIKNTYSNKSA